MLSIEEIENELKRMNSMAETQQQSLITVITVSYNAVKTIEQTMLSVLNQTYPNIEYIIIDGGSTDGTVDIIKKYANRLAYWVSEPDKGVYDAMDKGIDKATGDWLYFLGADDTLIDNVLMICSCFKNKQTIYYGCVQMSNRGIYRRPFNAWWLCRGNVCHQSIFYPKYVFEKYRYNLKYKIYADWYLNIECCVDRFIKTKYLQIVIANFNDEGLSLNGDDLFIKDLPLIIKNKFPIYIFFYIQIRKLFGFLLHHILL